MFDRWTSPALLGAMLLSSSVHAVPVVNALRDLTDVRLFVGDARAIIHDHLWTMYEIELQKEKPKEEKPQEEKKDDAPPPPKSLPPRAMNVPPPPPAAAQASKTMTAPDDGKPVDFSDFTMTQGAAETYAGGVTAADGKSKTAVYDRNARPDGSVGGTGKGPPPPAPPSTDKDMSRAASVQKARGISCPFPSEADQDDINNASVTVVVSLRPDGKPSGVQIVSDPGHGFGRAANQCVMSGRISFDSALDKAGVGIAGTTAPFRIKFER